jgi:hypothetical protein
MENRGHRQWRDLPPAQKAGVAVTTAIQLGLAAAAWADLAHRPASQIRGPKWRWALIIAVNYAGPLAYFRWGRARPSRGAE